MAKVVENFKVGDRVVISTKLSKSNNDGGAVSEMLDARGKPGKIVSIQGQNEDTISCKIDIVEDGPWKWSKSNLIKIANINKPSEEEPKIKIIKSFNAIGFLMAHKEEFDWDDLQEDACSGFVSDFMQIVEIKHDSNFESYNKTDAGLLESIDSDPMLSFLENNGFIEKIKPKLKYKVGDVVLLPVAVKEIDHDIGDEEDEELPYKIQIQCDESCSVWVSREWLEVNAKEFEDEDDDCDGD